ncbi:MAG: hypothetical protein IJ174_03990 [Clostridia bacterium]|nr:hypothetical protein [Clostridia bacterium]
MMWPEYEGAYSAATFTDTSDGIDALIEEFRKLEEQCEEARRDFDEFIYMMNGKYDKRQPYLQGWPRAPRRAVARGLSPVQCRYWVNYKARDKLPRTARKTPAMRTGGQGHAEKQKAGAGGRRGCH